MPIDTVPGLTFQQIASATAIVYFAMKWLKSQAWYREAVKNFPAADVWVYRGVAGILSLVASLGVTTVFAANASTGGWDLHIGIPSLNALYDSFNAINWATIFGAQQITYDATRAPVEMTKVPKPPKKKPRGHLEE